MATDTDLVATRAVQPGLPDVVLVTGGTSGIGSAIAHAMAGRGHTVIVCGRDEQRLTEVREAVPGAHAFRCDVTDESEVEALLADVNERFGRLDVLINNAGMHGVAPFVVRSRAFDPIRSGADGGSDRDLGVRDDRWRAARVS